MPFKNTENFIDIPPNSQYKNYVQEEMMNREYVYCNIMLINDFNDDRVLTEKAPVAIDQHQNVYFRDLIIYLREQNLIIPGSSIFFYDVTRQVYVHMGTEPVNNAMIPLSKFSPEQILIKYRPNIQLNARRINTDSFGYAQNTVSRECMQSSNLQISKRIQPSDLCSNNNANDSDIDSSVEPRIKAIPREKRVKERHIGYVFEKVAEWRRYYEQGVPKENGRLCKVNLDVAASMVGLSRKTLDDYYKYIRKAEQFNFDFEGQRNQKIGVLRNFVRDRMKRTKQNFDEMEDLKDNSSRRVTRRGEQLEEEDDDECVDELNDEVPNYAPNAPLPPPIDESYQSQQVLPLPSLQLNSQSSTSSSTTSTAQQFKQSRLELQRHCSRSSNSAAMLPNTSYSNVDFLFNQETLPECNSYQEYDNCYYPEQNAYISQCAADASACRYTKQKNPNDCMDVEGEDINNPYPYQHNHNEQQYHNMSFEQMNDYPLKMERKCSSGFQFDAFNPFDPHKMDHSYNRSFIDMMNSATPRNNFANNGEDYLDFLNDNEVAGNNCQED